MYHTVIFSFSTSKHLSDLVESPVGALDLKFRSDLKLELLLLKIHQVPLILQPGLTAFPELQKQSNCQSGVKKRNGNLTFNRELYDIYFIYTNCAVQV